MEEFLGIAWVGLDGLVAGLPIHGAHFAVFIGELICLQQAQSLLLIAGGESGVQSNEFIRADRCPMIAKIEPISKV